MRKSIILISAIVLCAAVEAKEVRLIKRGGQPCRSDKAKVCYDKIQIRSTDEIYSQSCVNPGLELCPKVGIVSIGDMDGMIDLDVDGFTIGVERAILSGKRSMQGLLVDSLGNHIANYSWTGSINSAGYVEYEILISDEI